MCVTNGAKNDFSLENCPKLSRAFLLTVADQGRFTYVGDAEKTFKLTDAEAVQEAHAFEKEFRLPVRWPLMVRETIESGENDELLDWAAHGDEAARLETFIGQVLRPNKRNSAAARARSPSSKAKHFRFPPTQAAPEMPGGLAEKSAASGDDLVENQAKSLEEMQRLFTAFQEERRVADKRVAELEAKLSGGQPKGPSMGGPPKKTAAPATGTAAKEIEELEARIAVLKGGAPPTGGSDLGSRSMQEMLEELLGGGVDDMQGKPAREGMPADEKNTKEALRRQMCTSLSYQVSELKKDRLGVRLEDAETIPQLWDAIRHRLTQESQFCNETRARMGELDDIFTLARDEAVRELNIVTGPLKRGPPELKTQVEHLFVAKLHRKIRQTARLADAPLFTLVSEAAQDCESAVQTKFKTLAGQHTADAAGSGAAHLPASTSARCSPRRARCRTPMWPCLRLAGRGRAFPGAQSGAAS